MTAGCAELVGANLVTEACLLSKQGILFNEMRSKTKVIPDGKMDLDPKVAFPVTWKSGCGGGGQPCCKQHRS